jgi:hypothetical protein
MFRGFVFSGNGEVDLKYSSFVRSSSGFGEPVDVMLAVSREGLRYSRSGTGGTLYIEPCAFEVARLLPDTFELTEIREFR